MAMAKTIALNSTVVTIDEENLIEAPLEDKLYMLDLEQSKYLYFNEVATAIWQKLRTPIEISDLCRTLQSEYDVPSEQCATEVLAFIEELCIKGIVRIVD